MRILVSGASVAGPVLAYWLDHHGFEVTVVERAPAPRRTGGHAVDLFRPAMEVVERMGLLPAIEERKTGTRHVTLVGAGSERPVRVDVGRLVVAFSDRHVEVMRDDLSEIFHGATRDRVEYVFGDSIVSLQEDAGGVDVTFETGAPRRFDLVIGADGVHSNVRGLAFGEESRFAEFVGTYLGVFSLPDYRDLDAEMLAYSDVGRMAAFYSAAHLDEARAILLFRSEELDYHHRDVPRQRRLLREAFSGAGWEVPRLLDEMDASSAFYFDSITQIRMDSWSRGRISLVGDAGYSPGAAVGGGTSLAVVGAYVLAGELAVAGGDHERAFRAYESELGEYVRRSRELGRGMARTLVPDSRFQLWATLWGTRLLARLPHGVIRALAGLRRTSVRPHDTIELRDYSGGEQAGRERV
ncbi:FAD-dependent monooxygenase [Streptosporangium sp. NBC_01495]|uniref:FAD-dependent monooxygenase n=1 Tax=Streptosporangium sp. NBC_01495 TaxID=2903899 RepID=UPI002E2EB168|nr:FAD-dependent monooxygenase [Streptosporangium sp. NBC_01495]